jgi:PAS domain S-box-containing protein
LSEATSSVQSLLGNPALALRATLVTVSAARSRTLNPPFSDPLKSSLAEESALGPTNAIATPVEHLDLVTAIKISRALSGTIGLEKLIDTLMRTAIEHSDAERGLLILPRGVEQRIEAEATTSGDSVIVQLRDEQVGGAALPESVLHYVLRTGESVILDDAAAQSAFGEDTYIRERQPRSVLCLPLINQGKLSGVLYLENNLNSGAAAPARTAVLKFLASQAAISLESAALYSNLRHSEAFLAEAQRLSQTGSFSWNVSSGKIVCSDEMFRIFGYDKMAPATLETALRRVHPEDLARVQGAIERVSQDRNDCAGDYRLLMPDGSIKHVHLVVRATNEGTGSIDFIAAVTDLTTVKEANQALQESEQRFCDYAETASDWYWETDPDHRFTPLTERVRELGRLPLTSRIGLARWDFAEDVESQPEKWKLHRSTLEARQPFRDFVYPAVRFDGSLMYVKVSGKPVYDAKGDFLGYRGTGNDVTAVVRADQAAAALSQMQAELVHISRITTLGELVASIAHEVNQPIAGTLASAQAALRWLGAETPNLDKARESLARMVRDSIRAAAVVDRIRNLIKKAPSREDRLDANAAIGEVIELTRSEATKNGVLVRTELSESLPLVRGDRVELQQVILNLVLNALEAMSALADGPRELQVTTSRSGSDHALIAVRDTGPGLTPAVEENLFKAFHTTKSKGLGLGLSICRSIVESRGGRMWASANAPRGAVFQFTLPIHPEIAT